LAQFFQKGDWRSGYYRDQTLMMALGMLQPEEFFSMIYGDPDESINPSTGGRNFNNHFSSRNIDADGRIENLSGNTTPHPISHPLEVKCPVRLAWRKLRK
jgi:TPP-dependent pyruvate/acetoin dehydrogenase alpha subunit